MIIKKIATNKVGQTVFKLADIGRLAGVRADRNLISAVSYYVKSGDLKRLSKGVYVLSESYSRYELGNKLRTPSYVSFYSVLQDKGVVFQPYNSVFLASLRSETKMIDGQKYVYRRINEKILLNPLGIESVGLVAVASLERAILDKIYLDGEEYFDNLKMVNWSKIEKLGRLVYKQKRILEYIKKVRKNA